MDESEVRQRAQAHADAVVAGDLRAAGADLDKAAMTAAGEVMPKLPKPLSGADIVAVSSDEDRATVEIAYKGEDRTVKVASVWAERDGTAKIIDLSVVSG